MAFVAATCTQCGGVLEVDSTQEAAICKYCKTPFIVEQAINNYSTTINIQDSGITADTLIGHAEILLKDKNFVKANEILDKVLERAPHDHRAHWGKLCVKLKLPDNSDSTIKLLAKNKYSFDKPVNADENVRGAISFLCNPHYNNAIQHAPSEDKAEYVSWYEKLIETANECVGIIKEKDEIKLKADKIKEEIFNENEKHTTELVTKTNAKFFALYMLAWMCLPIGAILCLTDRRSSARYYENYSLMNTWIALGIAAIVLFVFSIVHFNLCFIKSRKKVINEHLKIIEKLNAEVQLSENQIQNAKERYNKI